MKTFRDAEGREWAISVNVDSLRRVKTLASVNLLDIVQGKLGEELASDPVRLVDCLCALCRPEMESRKVSDEEFGRAMRGDAIDAAVAAMMEELIDFFPSRRRALLQKMQGTAAQLQDRAMELMLQKLDSGELLQSLEKQLGNSASPSPGSAESPPGH
jgi:hypothetical protein